MHLFYYTKWFKSLNSNPFRSILYFYDAVIFWAISSFCLISKLVSILNPCLILEVCATFFTAKMAYPLGDLSVDLILDIEFCLDPTMLACGFCLSLAVSTTLSASEFSKKSICDKFPWSRACETDLEFGFLKPLLLKFLRAPGDFTPCYLLRKSAVFPGLSSASSLGISWSVSSCRNSWLIAAF